MPFDFSQLAPLLWTVGGMVAVFPFIPVFSVSAILNGINTPPGGEGPGGDGRGGGGFSRKKKWARY